MCIRDRSMVAETPNNRVFRSPLTAPEGDLSLYGSKLKARKILWGKQSGVQDLPLRNHPSVRSLQVRIKHLGITLHTV